MNLAELDGVTVSARALGWDGSESDGTDWALERGDLPRLTTQIGALTVHYVEDLDYTQFVVNGIPVDPATISRVDYDGVEVLVATGGWEGVPRDAEGKWTAGPFDAALEKLLLVEEAIAAGKNPYDVDEAAAIEAALLEKAEAWHAAQQEKHGPPDAPWNQGPSPEALADQALTDYLLNHGKGTLAVTMMPPTGAQLDIASIAHVDAYLQKVLSPEAYQATKQLVAADVRKLAMATAAKHTEDLDVLQKIGYKIGEPATPAEAHRALLRETGMRKPTGGPMDGGRTFYGEAVISGMTRAKQEAIILHHAGGNLDANDLKDWGDEDVKYGAIASDDDYGKVMAELTAMGADMSKVPHSVTGAQAFKSGASQGLPSNAAKIAVKPIASPVAAAVGMGGHPANWAQMSPGKKAAWTKKYGKGHGNAYVTTPAPALIPHPADWASMSPGKKAAWTKKYGIAGVSTSKSGSKPGVGTGKHETSTFGTNSEAYKAARTAAKITAAPGDVDAHNARYSALSKNLYANDTEAKSAWQDYIGGGYTAMNRFMKYGEVGYGHTTETLQKKVDALHRAFTHYGTPAPVRLIRGKAKGPMLDLTYNVGDTYTEPGYGSWSLSSGTARSFGGMSSTSGGYSSGNKVITRLLNSKQVRSVPGTSSERETIMPRGTNYKVVGIKDFLGPAGQQYRVIDVEVV